MEIRGPEAPLIDEAWTYRFLRARANSIEGGTTEILKNIVAERVLGLPKLAMNFDFTDDQRSIKSTAKEFLAARYKPEKLRELAEAGEYDDAIWNEMRELGWAGIFVDEEYEGQGLGIVELVILMEELGYALAPSPFLSNAAAGLVIQQAGSDEQKQKWLPGHRERRAARRRSARSRTEARRWSPTRRTRQLIVLFDCDTATVVERSAADVEKVDTIDSTRKFASVSADGGEALEGDVQAGLDRVATAIAAELTGVAQRTMEMAVDYAKERKQFERPIGAYQAVSHRCAQMLMEVESARALTYFAAYAADSEPDELSLAASAAKAYASDAGLARERVVAPGARRHRLHLGARPPLLPEAREDRRPPLRHRAPAPRPRRGAQHGARRRARLAGRLRQVALAGREEDRLLEAEVADLDLAALDGRESAVAAVGDGPLRAAHGGGGVAPAGAVAPLRVAAQAADRCGSRARRFARACRRRSP